MRNLITIQELKTLGRPIGKVQDDRLAAYITEVEQLYIKTVIGTSLYNRLISDDVSNDEKKLLAGGEYVDKCGNEQSFMGLKTALSYFVYAQNIMSGDFLSTRYGIVVKDGDYSTHISSKERSDAYNNALEVANAYLRDCVAFARDKQLVKCSEPKRPKYAVGGVTIKRIG